MAMCVQCMHACVFQGQIQWTEVDESTFVYDIDVSNAAGHMYGVAVKHSGGQSGPIHWVSCLYSSSERLYFNNMLCLRQRLPAELGHC